MSFTDAVRTCFGKYGDFSGRATRPELWWFVLFYNLIALPFVLVGGLLLIPALTSNPDDPIGPLFFVAIGIMIIGGLAQLACLVPMLAVGSRRLHDYGQTGWWQLLLLLGGIGVIVLIVFWVLEGAPEDNEYGPKPA
jgi:uncharacterized membrane protein YhaH (DUF805 family)